MKRLRSAFVLAALFLAGPALAEEAGQAPLPEPAVTEHALDLDEGSLEYEARVEMLELTGDAGEATARIGTFAYIAEDAGADRPVTFLMNGGPGAASAYLHVGGVGPWAIATDELGRPVGRGTLEENAESWLAFTDLVFIDPVGTGFSRPVDPEDDRFYDREADLDSIAEVIELWLDRQGRRTSPVYVGGESYGGYRAAALPKRLMHDRGVQLAGAVLISPVIDFAMIRHDDASPMSWALTLPSFAATAAGHDLAEPVSAGALREFALEDYLLALVHPERMDALVDELAELTGVDAALWRERRGRIRPHEFTQTLLGEEREMLSAYDGLLRVPRPERSQAGSRVDPILEGMAPAFKTGLVHHLRARLDWTEGRDYELLSRAVNRAWRYGSRRAQGYVSALGDLEEVMALDPDFRIFASHGETDLVTPWLASEWLFGQLADTVEGASERVAFRRYPGGHMFYMRPDAKAELYRDAERFYRGR